jgi:hypothetical protein
MKWSRGPISVHRAGGEGFARGAEGASARAPAWFSRALAPASARARASATRSCASSASAWPARCSSSSACTSRSRASSCRTCRRGGPGPRPARPSTKCNARGSNRPVWPDVRRGGASSCLRRPQLRLRGRLPAAVRVKATWGYAAALRARGIRPGAGESGPPGRRLSRLLSLTANSGVESGAESGVTLKSGVESGAKSGPPPARQ